MLSHYQTGPWITLAFFIGTGVLFVYGFVSALHFHNHNGWIQVVMAPLILNGFHQRFSRDSKLP